MKKAIVIIAAFSVLASSPALADDSAIDAQTMVDAIVPQKQQPIDLPINGFDLNKLSGDPGRSLMVTMAAKFDPGYRVDRQDNAFATEPDAGLAALLVPQEFAIRFQAQDSGVDAITPGRFLPSSVRPDYLADTGPGATDKSSVGVRFGF